MSVELEPAAAAAHPGERLAYRVRNTGTLPILFGEMFALERENGEHWTRCRLPYAFRAIGHSLGVGGEKELVIPVPGDAPPGRYRLTQDVRVGEEPGPFTVVTASFVFTVQE